MDEKREAAFEVVTQVILENSAKAQMALKVSLDIRERLYGPLPPSPTCAKDNRNFPVSGIVGRNFEIMMASNRILDDAMEHLQAIIAEIPSKKDEPKIQCGKASR